MEMLQTPDFWIAGLLKIIWINIPCGDNAVVIALACRRTAAQQRLAIMYGSGWLPWCCG